VSYKERVVAVSASCFLYAVRSYRPSVLVCLSTIVVTVCIFGAMCRVAKALTS
jgi:hypothetical protein